MATALISQPVLPANAPAALAAKPVANPKADTSVYLNGLLDELRQRTDAIPVVPGCSVAISHDDLMELRGLVSNVIVGFRNQLRWAK